MSIHEATLRLRGEEPPQREPLSIQDCEQVAAVAATGNDRYAPALVRQLAEELAAGLREARSYRDTLARIAEPGDEAVRPDIEAKVALGRLGFGALLAKEHRA